MRLLIADRHQLVIDGLKEALGSAENMEIVGETRRGSEVLRLVDRLRPDAVLLDMRMPEVDGPACIESIVERFPTVRVIVLSIDTSREQIASALRSGACAYIIPTFDPADLPATIRNAVEGTVFHALRPTRDESRADTGGLTARELTILRSIAYGQTNGEIARELWVTEATVKFHLTNIYRKLEVSNRTQAARAALRLGVARNLAVVETDPSKG